MAKKLKKQGEHREGVQLAYLPSPAQSVAELATDPGCQSAPIQRARLRPASSHHRGFSLTAVAPQHKRVQHRKEGCAHLSDVCVLSVPRFVLVYNCCCGATYSGRAGGTTATALGTSALEGPLVSSWSPTVASRQSMYCWTNLSVHYLFMLAQSFSVRYQISGQHKGLLCWQSPCRMLLLHNWEQQYCIPLEKTPRDCWKAQITSVLH